MNIVGVGEIVLNSVRIRKASFKSKFRQVQHCLDLARKVPAIFILEKNCPSFESLY